MTRFFLYAILLLFFVFIWLITLITIIESINTIPSKINGFSIIGLKNYVSRLCVLVMFLLLISFIITFIFYVIESYIREKCR